MKTSPTTSRPPNSPHRLTVSLQDKGNVGKSSEVIARTDWLLARGISFRGYDLDPDHRSYRQVYPGLVDAIDVSDFESALAAILRRANAVPISILDPQAHMGQRMVAFFRKTDFLHRCSDLGVRLTVVVHLANEVDVLNNIYELTDTLGSSVDYLTVRNRFVAPVLSMFEQSATQQALKDLNTRVLEIPEIYEGAKRAVAAAEHKVGTALSLATLTGKDSPLDPLTKGFFEVWRRDLHAAYDRVADVLVPTEMSAHIQPSEVPIATSRPPRTAAVSLD